jgi:hypothetical protein
MAVRAPRADEIERGLNCGTRKRAPVLMEPLARRIRKEPSRLGAHASKRTSRVVG